MLRAAEEETPSTYMLRIIIDKKYRAAITPEAVAALLRHYKDLPSML